MKSIVSEALARHEEAKAKEEAAPQRAHVESGDDEEIQKIVDSLNVSIKIIGCGGGGSNTVNRCSEAGVQGAQLCAVNTDAKHLLAVHAPKKILIGKRLTKGLGAGALPEVGEQAAKESEEEIRGFTQGAHIVFVTAYDRYAVEAFERGAIDYVLKPVAVERLAETVRRLPRDGPRVEAGAPLAGEARMEGDFLEALWGGGGGKQQSFNPNKKGRFVYEGLSPGEYRVEVKSHKGVYEDWSQSGVKLDSGSSPLLKVSLKKK